MPGLGTLVNCASIAAGGIIGMLFGKKLKKDTRDALMKVMGVCVIFTGLSGTLSKMLVPAGGGLSVYGTVQLIVCLAAGTFLGELLKIEGLLDRAGDALKRKFAENDDGFTSAFVNTSLVVSIGAMAIVGAIQDGISRDISTLLAKSLLDFLIVLIMASTLGFGCVFAFIPVGVLQGSVTAAAKALEKYLSVGTVIGDISLVGNVMIFCIGVNLVFGRKFRVGNMLPALILCIAWSLIAYYVK